MVQYTYIGQNAKVSITTHLSATATTSVLPAALPPQAPVWASQVTSISSTAPCLPREALHTASCTAGLAATGAVLMLVLMLVEVAAAAAAGVGDVPNRSGWSVQRVSQRCLPCCAAAKTDCSDA